MKTEKLARKIAGAIVGRQTRMANYLNRKTQHWNKASKLMALITFITLFGCLSAWLIIKSFI